jgi:hypothetical protein
MSLILGLKMGSENKRMLYLNLVVTGVTLDEVKQRFQAEQWGGSTTGLQDDSTFRNEHAALTVKKPKKSRGLS